MSTTTIETERAYPMIQNEFLRYQAGRVERRVEDIPVFRDHRLLKTVKGELMVPVFRLLGWGDSPAKARKMAEEAERKA
jgi:hypothetical protein